jgi:hypothetical protein
MGETRLARAIAHLLPAARLAVLRDSIPVLRTAGGFIVAVAGWAPPRTSLIDQTFNPLTLPSNHGAWRMATVMLDTM